MDRQLICLGPGRDYSLETSSRSEGFMIRFTGAFLEAGGQAPDLSYQDDLYWLFATPVAMTVKEEMVEEMKAIAARMVTENENLFYTRARSFGSISGSSLFIFPGIMSVSQRW